VLLQVVPDAWNISRNFNSVGQPDASYFSQSGVRLLGRLCVHAGADTALLRTSLQGWTRRLVPRPLTAASHQLIESRHTVSGAPVRCFLRCSRTHLQPAALTGTRSRTMHIRFSLISGAGWRKRQPCFPQRRAPAGEFGFPFRLKAADGGTKPATSGSCSVSSAPPRIAFQRVKGARRAFSARASPVLFPRRRLLLKLSCIVQGFPHAQNAACKKPIAYRQARLNSRNLTNIAIPFTHRQWPFLASDGNDGFTAEQECGFEIDESWPDISGRVRGAVLETDPSLRSGFRLRARTPATRLNLLKKILASTLGAFQKVSKQARLADAQGGEGAWVGRSRWCGWHSSSLSSV